MSRIKRIAMTTVGAGAIRTAQNAALDYRPEAQARRRNAIAQMMQQARIEAAKQAVGKKKKR